MASHQGDENHFYSEGNNHHQRPAADRARASRAHEALRFLPDLPFASGELEEKKKHFSEETSARSSDSFCSFGSPAPRTVGDAAGHVLRTRISDMRT